MANNPYSPPKSNVADVASQSGEFQEINLWSIQGRIGRLRYLAYSTGAAFVFWIIIAVATAALGASGIGVITIVAYIGLLIFTFMMAIQRSHDMDWSGWTVLLLFIPLVAFIWVFKAGSPDANSYGDPPPPNTRAVKILGLTFPIIAVIGIIAAIALPAYQSYVKRAHMTQQQ